MFSSPRSFSNLVLLSTLLTAILTLTGAATLGVDYGKEGNNLTSSEVVDLYKSQGIKAMRIYYPYADVLQALRGSGIELVLGVPNTDLQQLASDTSFAKTWVQTNVLNYYPDVTIKYIAVGNEVTPVNAQSQYAQFLITAMTNIFNAVKDADLFQKVRVSTALDTSVIDEKTAFPPSAGDFKGEVMGFMNPIIGFLTDTGAPIMFSIYPYFTYINDPNIKLSYASFTNQSPEFTDKYSGLAYYNLFDAILDGVYSALDRHSGPAKVDGVNSQDSAGHKVPVVVIESGWKRSSGPPLRSTHRGRRTLLSLDDACTYDQNLVLHVTSSQGTPKRPGAPIETYLFSMFDKESESGFGLFSNQKQPLCPINFHQT